MADVASSPISEYGRHLSTQQSHNDVIIELERAIKDRNMEIEQGKDELSNSKDRAQTTASSVLSLSLIALLKEILQGGPARTRYFGLSLAMVIVSLALQFVVGILTLYMFHIQRKLTVLHKSKSVRIRQSDSNFAGVLNDDPDGPLDGGEELETSFSYVNQQDVVCVLMSPSSSTCDFDKVRKHLMLTYADYLIKFQKLQFALMDPSQAATDIECQRNKSMLEVVRSQLHMLDTKEVLVDKMYLVKQKNRIQNAVSYIMYITFVMNAILVGLGISQEPDNSAVVGPTSANFGD